MKQHTILIRIQLIVLTLLYGMTVQAQTIEKYGTFFNDAIPVVLSGNRSIFTDKRNTDEKPSVKHYYYNFRYIPLQGNEYSYTQGKAVYYQLDLPLPGNLIIHNWKTDYSAGPGYTTLHVLRKTQKGETEDWSEGELSFKWVATFEEHDFMDPGFDPISLGMPERASSGQAYLSIPNLSTGTYYIVTAGYKYSNSSIPNGIIQTTVIADLVPSIPDEPELKPEKPNYSPMQYQYDESGNRVKTIQKNK